MCSTEHFQIIFGRWESKNNCIKAMQIKYDYNFTYLIKRVKMLLIIFVDTQTIFFPTWKNIFELLWIYKNLKKFFFFKFILVKKYPLLFSNICFRIKRVINHEFTFYFVTETYSPNFIIIVNQLFSRERN